MTDTKARLLLRMLLQLSAATIVAGAIAIVLGMEFIYVLAIFGPMLNYFWGRASVFADAIDGKWFPA